MHRSDWRDLHPETQSSTRISSFQEVLEEQLLPNYDDILRVCLFKQETGGSRFKYRPCEGGSIFSQVNRLLIRWSCLFKDRESEMQNDARGEMWTGDCNGCHMYLGCCISLNQRARCLRRTAGKAKSQVGRRASSASLFNSWLFSEKAAVLVWSLVDRPFSWVLPVGQNGEGNASNAQASSISTDYRPVRRTPPLPLDPLDGVHSACLPLGEWPLLSSGAGHPSIRFSRQFCLRICDCSLPGALILPFADVVVYCSL